MSTLITFGEVMARIEPVPPYRFRQALPGTVNLSFAGAEANVAASYVLLGGKAVFVTALPENPLADACLGQLRGIGVDTNFVIRPRQGRMGLLFLETGACQRPSSIWYDRSNSSVSLMKPEAYDWDHIFMGASWFHFSGITPAISETAAESCIEAARRAKAAGLGVSIDLNFRKKLWNWRQGTGAKELAREVIGKILPYVDIVIGNEEDASDVLGITAGTSDAAAGVLDTKRYPDVARKIAALYPNVSMVAFTLRESVSATHNNWGAVLWVKDGDRTFYAPMKDDAYRPYRITDIVDRVGAGDSFAAGLLFALHDPEFVSDLNSCVSFAVASSCLCHTIRGDINYVSRSEVVALMKGDASGRVRR